jgi:hypothetical protein
MWKYQDVFAWNKGEFGYCTIGEHVVDIQGFPPCKVFPSWLSYWKEVEVKRQINVLVDLGKVKPNNFDYACCVTLLVKKDGSRCLCDDYQPLNMQTRWNSFLMPLVDYVITQLGNPFDLLHWICSLVFGKFGWHLKIWKKQPWSLRLDYMTRQSCLLVLKMQPTLLPRQCQKKI